MREARGDNRRCLGGYLRSIEHVSTHSEWVFVRLVLGERL